MSGIFNIKIGGTDVEDVICNGQVVEEVRVNGTTVFDAYDPQAVPNGTLNFSVIRDTPSSYNEASSGYTATGSGVGATGYIYLKTGSPTVLYSLNPNQDDTYRADQFYTSTGSPVSSNFSTSTELAVCKPDGSNVLSISIDNEHPNMPTSGRGDTIYAGGEDILRYSAHYHGETEARIEWNFKTKKVTVSGTNFSAVTKDFNVKWREGMYVRLTRSATNRSSNWYAYTGQGSGYEKAYRVYATSQLTAYAGN